MKLKIIYIAIIVAISNLSFADGRDEEAYKTYTGEVLQCNFNEGKDLDDALNMVRKDWYKMAQSYPAPYEGNIVTPQLYASTDGGYDLFWVGFTPDNNAMGEVTDWFSANASKVFTKWQNIVNCASWSQWDIFEVRESKADFEEGDDNYWAFHSCSFKSGKSLSDIRENDETWNEFLDGLGHTGGVWRWWGAGGSSLEETNDFYVNMGFNSMTEYGNYRDARLQSLVDGSYPETIADCQPPRVYSVNNIKAIID